MSIDILSFTLSIAGYKSSRVHIAPRIDISTFTMPNTIPEFPAVLPSRWKFMNSVPMAFASKPISFVDRAIRILERMESFFWVHLTTTGHSNQKHDICI